MLLFARRHAAPKEAHDTESMVSLQRHATPVARERNPTRHTHGKRVFQTRHPGRFRRATRCCADTPTRLPQRL